MTWPVPPHCGQGWLIEKNPWPWASIPRPSQRGQVSGLVPGSAPEPEQVGQRSDFGMVTVIWVPVIASSNEMRMSVSRSRPFIGFEGARTVPDQQGTVAIANSHWASLRPATRPARREEAVRVAVVCERRNVHRPNRPRLGRDLQSGRASDDSLHRIPWQQVDQRQEAGQRNGPDRRCRTESVPSRRGTQPHRAVVQGQRFWPGAGASGRRLEDRRPRCGVCDQRRPAAERSGRWSSKGTRSPPTDSSRRK